MQPTRLIALASLLLTTPLPALPALAGLDASFTNATAATMGGQDQQASAVTTPSPGGGLDVTVGAVASGSYDLGATYDGDFDMSATWIGSGFLDYGFGAANVDVMVQATPQFVDSLIGGSPAANGTEALAIGAMDLRFSEVGVVTGSTPGAPVTLTLHVGVESTPIAVGGVLWDEHFARAKMYARVIDNDGGFVGAEREALNAQVLDFELDTAVGHHLSIEGRFRAEVEGTAGGRYGPYVHQFLGEIHEAAGGFWIEAPAGVGFEAPSGTDYTVNPLTVPEPGGPLLALVGAVVLIAGARARRARH